MATNLTRNRTTAGGKPPVKRSASKRSTNRNGAGYDTVVKAAAESLLGYMIMLARRDEASVLHESTLYEPFHLTVLSRGYKLFHEVRVKKVDGKNGDKKRVDYAIYERDVPNQAALVEMKIMATNLIGKESSLTQSKVKDDIPKLLSKKCYFDLVGKDKNDGVDVGERYLILCNCSNDFAIWKTISKTVPIKRIAKYEYRKSESHIYKNVLVYRLG